MAEPKSIQEQHTAAPQAIGFDYQFYYFVFLLLNLQPGEEIGFEVKDDVHIERKDNSVILYQTKHTIQQNKLGKTINLTLLDTDLWKTLSNWAEMINHAEDKKKFTEQHTFILSTNKNTKGNNFILALDQFKEDSDILNVISLLNDLKNNTSDISITKHIQNVINLKKRALGYFLNKLKIKTGCDGIIKKIKDKIASRFFLDDEELVNSIYESLISNLQEAKYIDIKSRNKFQIGYGDFRTKFSKCFKPAYQNKRLPKRDLPIVLPDNLNSQIVIKQLIDIEDIFPDSEEEIVEYTTQMLQAFNYLDDWINNGYILPTELKEFENESILKWKNKFKGVYREIRRKHHKGGDLAKLEKEIKELAGDVLDFVRQVNLKISDYPDLEISTSNGYYYLLSNDLQIGWHYNWENKYKK